MGLNLRSRIKETRNRIAAFQSKWASRLLEKSEVSKKVRSRIVNPADMIKPTEEAFKLFKAVET